MPISILNDSNTKLYEDYVSSHPEGMLYYSNKYRLFLEHIIQKKSNYLISKNANDEINGIFPIFKSSSKYGNIWNSLPYYGSHGSVLSDSRDIEEQLYDYAYEKYFKDSAGYTIITRPKENSICDDNKFDFQDERIGQWTELFEDKADILKNIDSSTRRNIKKAEQENIQISIDNDAFNFLEEVHVENINSINGLAKNNRFFEAVKKYFEPGKDYNIYTAEIDGVKVSALLIFYYKNIVEYFVPVTVSGYRNKQPSALIILQAMLDAAKEGFSWWNWGGTWKSQEGVYRFKKKWGAQDKTYKYYIKINNKELLNQTSYKLLEMYPDFYVVPFSVLEK